MSAGWDAERAPSGARSGRPSPAGSYFLRTRPLLAVKPFAVGFTHGSPCS